MVNKGQHLVKVVKERTLVPPEISLLFHIPNSLNMTFLKFSRDIIVFKMRITIHKGFGSIVTLRIVVQLICSSQLLLLL